jgi:NADPH-dependent dioxygenase
MLWKRDIDVLVAGAGPVGLFAALALSHRGLRVEVVDEQHRTTSRSYALALHPQSLELLEDLELVRPVLEAGHRIGSIAFYGGGERQAEVRFEAISARFPYLLAIPQHALEQVLEQRLSDRGIAIYWNHRLAELDQGESAMSVQLEKIASSWRG